MQKEVSSTYRACNGPPGCEVFLYLLSTLFFSLLLFSSILVLILTRPPRHPPPQVPIDPGVSLRLLPRVSRYLPIVYQGMQGLATTWCLMPWSIQTIPLVRSDFHARHQ